MLKHRVIPVLLIKNNGLVKTVNFKKEKYVGDPINAIKIFNEKEVDELVLLDISASKNLSGPNYRKIEEVVSECFMPLCYGGGVTNINEFGDVLSIGVEKVSLNHGILEDTRLISEAADKFGVQSVVVSIDIKKNLFGKYKVFSHCKGKISQYDPLEFAATIENAGAGEILLNVVDRDGLMQGYDVQIIRDIADKVNVPLIACGGAGKIEDIVECIQDGKASAAAAGSMFVFHGKHKAVLISYPNYKELEERLNRF